MMETIEKTCIVCPVGCLLTITMDNGQVTGVTGNTCKRGPAYAIEECTAPKRMLTTTIRTGFGKPAPVKTSAAIPKGLLFQAMEAINAVVWAHPAKRGTVVLANLLDTGIDVVLTDDIIKEV